jgi:hypothetical protein
MHLLIPAFLLLFYRSSSNSFYCASVSFSTDDVGNTRRTVAQELDNSTNPQGASQ